MVFKVLRGLVITKNLSIGYIKKTPIIDGGFMFIERILYQIIS